MSRLATTCGVVLLLLLVFCKTSVQLGPPPERSYNILMMLPVSAMSHRNVFMPLATSLTERGHKITILSNNPPQDDNPNIRYLRPGFTTFKEGTDMFEIAKDPQKMFDMFNERFPIIAREFYKDPVCKDLYEKRDQYDLFIIDALFNEVTYPFVHDRTFITIAPGNLDPALSAAMGNLQNPAYVANFLTEYPRPLSFVDRIKNIVTSIAGPLSMRSSILKPVQMEMDKRFPDMPPLTEVTRNQSLTLINFHHSFGLPIPLLPNQVEVGGMHLRPAQPLPKELQKLVSGNTPVIYISMGSVAQSTTMPDEYKKILLSTFAKLPYKILWKFEEEFPNLPKNVHIMKWIPQQDILAHPNVKLFITHCGMLSSQEAMYHSTPLLGLPIFGDQPKNAQYLENLGVGRWLTWPDLTEQRLLDSIKEVIENPSYRNKMAEVSRRFKDQPEKPVERAVYWTEYVIRHKGALHLRSPEWYLSWIELLHIDIALFVHLIGFILYKTVKKICALCYCFSRSSNKPAKKSKNKRE